MEEREMYIICRKDGSMMLGSEYYGRNWCIKQFIKCSRYTWRQYYSMGIRCKKVKVTYKFI